MHMVKDFNRVVEVEEVSAQCRGLTTFDWITATSFLLPELLVTIDNCSRIEA